MFGWKKVRSLSRWAASSIGALVILFTVNNRGVYITVYNKKTRPFSVTVVQNKILFRGSHYKVVQAWNCYLKWVKYGEDILEHHTGSCNAKNSKYPGQA